MIEDIPISVMRGLDHMILPFFPIILASIAHAATIPSVCAHPNFLLDIGAERQSVSSAFFTTVWKFTWIFRIIV